MTATAATAARAHMVASASLAAAFLVVAIGYIVVASRKGFRFAHNATGMTAMWAALLAATGLSAEAIVQRLLQRGQQQERLYPAAVRAFQALLLLMFFVATVSLACLKDAHGAVWSALAAVALGAVMANRRRLSKMGEPKASPVVPLKAADAQQHRSPQEEGAHMAQAPPATSTCRRKCARCCCLWTPLVLATVIAVAFGMGAAMMTAVERVLYPAPGTHYVLSAAPNSSETVRMHMNCMGQRDAADPTRPVVIFEHGGGSSSFTFFNVQEQLAAQGIRSCAYDRPGFGWSESLPVGWESLATYDRLLHSLLQAAGEAPPYLMAGHSAGVELVQVYAHRHPEDVAAVSLLDGYPDYLLLMGLTPAQAKQETTRVCGILQAARAFEGAGLLRPIWMHPPDDFEPRSEARRQSR